MDASSRSTRGGASKLESFHPEALGPYGENGDLVEDLLVDVVRDHVHWRRNCVDGYLEALEDRKPEELADE